jgi:hypothetical protein
MPSQGSAGLRARIPAALAAVTTATMERASRLLQEANQAIQARRAKSGWPGGTPLSQRRGPANNERSGGDDTH